MQQVVNKAYKGLFNNDKRYIILLGGRGAGRSTGASQLALSKLIAPEYFRCAIMRYVLGDIRNSIYREIVDRIDEVGITDSVRINDSMMTFEYGSNMINAVGFKKSSGDQKAKLKSLANYNYVIIEEADEVKEEDFRQLDDSLRTLKSDIKIILLLNPPPKSHWIIKRWFNLLPTEVPDFYIPELKKEADDTLFIRTTYKDNIQNIAEPSIRNYESYRLTNPSHYYTMVKGYVPETVTGKIYKNWREIERVPFEARLERIGIDFGYTNDPTAIIAVYYHDGGYILHEIAYKTGMVNSMIASTIIQFLNGEQCLVIADSAEPKSIDEIKMYGVDIYPAMKGQGSINNGIQIVQNQKISYTKVSKNIKEEYENYAWYVDKDGNTLNKPKDEYNHAMDSSRYALVSLLGAEKIEPQVGTVTYHQY